MYIWFNFFFKCTTWLFYPHLPTCVPSIWPPFQIIWPEVIIHNNNDNYLPLYEPGLFLCFVVFCFIALFILIILTLWGHSVPTTLFYNQYFKCWLSPLVFTIDFVYTMYIRPSFCKETWDNFSCYINTFEFNLMGLQYLQMQYCIHCIYLGQIAVQWAYVVQNVETLAKLTF